MAAGRPARAGHCGRAGGSGGGGWGLGGLVKEYVRLKWGTILVLKHVETHCFGGYANPQCTCISLF